MFTQAELIDAINGLENSKHTVQNCERLAAIYTVLDHLYPEEKSAPTMRGYSMDNNLVNISGESEFIKTINGKPEQTVWPLIDELVKTIAVLNPRLYSSFINKLSDL